MDDPWKDGKNSTNAALQSRSLGRRRISHPLLGDAARGDSTPPRSRGAEEDSSSSSTPRPPPGRADSGEDGGKTRDSRARRMSYASSVGVMAAHVESSRSLLSRDQGKKPPLQRSPSDSSSSRVSKGSKASLGKSSLGKSSLSKPRRSAVPKAARSTGKTSHSAAPSKSVWRFAVPILLAFLACEIFLWLLVFRSQEGPAAGDAAVGVDGPTPAKGEVRDGVDWPTPAKGEVGDSDVAVGVDRPAPANGEVGDGDAAIGVDGLTPAKGEVEDGDVAVGDDLDAIVGVDERGSDLKSNVQPDPISQEGVAEEDKGEKGEANDDDAAGGSDSDAIDPKDGMDVSEPRGESAAEEPANFPTSDVEESPNGAALIQGEVTREGLPAEQSPNCAGSIDEEIARLQSTLEEGFARLRGPEEGPDDGSGRTSVESLCGNAWAIASEKLSLGSPDGSSGERGIEPVGDKLPEITLEEMSQMASTNPWKSLALESQRCLGGAGLAFLADEVDRFRLGLSTKIFDRLSYLEPYDPNVRAGLGTSLLLESIFRRDDGDSSETASDDAHQLLLRAKYHLKKASFLCSVSPSTAAGAAADDASFGETNAGVIPKKLSNADGDKAATTAAVLHNLALAHIALGDDEGSVPFLLRAAALRSELPDTSRPYWNAPHEVLRAAEERAVSIGARVKRERRRRIAFLGANFNVGEVSRI